MYNMHPFFHNASQRYAKPTCVLNSDAVSHQTLKEMPLRVVTFLLYCGKPVLNYPTRFAMQRPRGGGHCDLLTDFVTPSTSLLAVTPLWEGSW